MGIYLVTAGVDFAPTTSVFFCILGKYKMVFNDSLAFVVSKITAFL